MALRTSVTLGLLLLGMSCTRFSFEANLDHCTYNGGDDYCAANFPDTPLCSSGQGECSIGDRIGCVANVSAQCHAPCGEPGDLSCVADGGSSSGGSGSSGATTEATSTGSSSDGPTTTTGVMPCMADEDCTDAAAPFCGEAGECVDCSELPSGDEACAAKDPDHPLCDAGQCVACTAELPGACGGQTPVCTEDHECRACDEHADCPESACHLDGPLIGACFEVAEVVEAFTEAELRMAVDPAGAGRVVVRLTNTNYPLTASLVLTNDEVAILGTDATISHTGDPVVSVGGTSIAYLDGVVIAGGLGRGLSCSGNAVWTDYTFVRNSAEVGVDISLGCAAHLRRTSVRSNAGGGLMATGATTTVFIVDSAISGNGAGAGRGIVLSDASIDMRYSTVVRNDGFNGDTFLCSGGTSGTVRNSILNGRDAPSISACDMITFDNNAADVDLGGSNTLVDVADESVWFMNFFNGDFRLSAAGIDALADIAMWGPGDPLFDYQGDPIPTDVASFPGWDQPQ